MTNLFALNSTQALAGMRALLSVGAPFEKKRRLGITLALWTALALPGWVQAQNNAQTRPADYIVAVVNSEPITNKEVQTLKLRLQKQLPPGTPSPSPQVLTQQALDQLINEKAQLQQARDNGIRVDDNEVDQAELNIARQNQISKEDLYKRLAIDGLSVTGFRDQLRNQLTITRLRERDVDSKARISDADVEQQIQREQAGQPNSPKPIDLNLAMILIAVPENSSDKEVAELKLKAQQLAQRAKAGESFAALALSFSQAMDKGANGGEMGLRAADRYPSLFVESTQALRIGEITEPVQSGAGFHILKVLDK
jgi:peptidyl-prolyl cis-trans isomerase SurA